MSKRRKPEINVLYRPIAGGCLETNFSLVHHDKPFVTYRETFSPTGRALWGAAEPEPHAVSHFLESLPKDLDEEAQLEALHDAMREWPDYWEPRE